MASGEERRLGKEAVTAAEKDEFPVGMRVLAVEDDRVCLKVLEALLRHCKYQPTMVQDGATALRMLQEGRDHFDLVISDVHMPDMDGFELLELIGLQMDIPVIMLSANEEKEFVYKGIESGACCYLVKPVKIKELKNIWHHVVRRRTPDLRVRPTEIVEGERGDAKSTGKQKYSNMRERNGDQDDLDENKGIKYSSTKKPRVKWTKELHGLFLQVVNRIGIDRAVPMNIWEMMNVSYITRENVASHLQKYRLYLKRVSDYTGRRSYPFSDPCERWSSYHGMDDPGSYKQYHHEYESSSSSGNLFARMDSPFGFGDQGVRLSTQSFQLRNPGSNPEMVPVVHGGSMLKDGRTFPPSGPSANSNGNLSDHTMLYDDDDDDDEIPSCYHDNSANILCKKILEASKVTHSCHIDDNFENMPSGAAMSVPLNKFPVQSVAMSVPVNEFQVQSPQMGNQPSVQMNCTLPGDDSELQDIVGNCSRSWQTVVPTEFPDLGHGDGDGACSFLGALQANMPNINQPTSFVASSGQIPVRQDRMAALMSNSTLLSGFNEHMLPFDIAGNTISMEMLGENFAFGNASSISSVLPDPEMDSLIMPTQILNVEGAVGILPMLREDMVGQQALGDQLDYNNQVLADQLNHNNQVRDDQLDYNNQALDDQHGYNNQALDDQHGYNNQALNDHLNIINNALDNTPNFSNLYDQMNYGSDFLVGTDESNISASMDEFFANFPTEGFTQDDAFMGGD